MFASQAWPQSSSLLFFFTSFALTMWISGTVDMKVAGRTQGELDRVLVDRLGRARLDNGQEQHAGPLFMPSVRSMV